MLEPRYKMTGGAVVVGERVIVAGGGRTVEILDTVTGSSRVIAEFDGRRSFATASLLENGDLLVVGGYGDRIELRREARVVDLDG